MVAYQPPDNVVLMIGASFRAASIIEAATRLSPVVTRDKPGLVRLGVTENLGPDLLADAQDLQRSLQDPILVKHDTPLQMAGLQELMTRVRVWLTELRDRAALNLFLDRPALLRLWSPMPEVADGYPRDVLRELEERVSGAKDLRPRLEDVGIDDKFVGQGRKYMQQLQTAIGKQDLDGANLAFKQRKFYLKKGQVYLKLKRVVRAGQIAYRDDMERYNDYWLPELEPDPRTLETA